MRLLIKIFCTASLTMVLVGCGTLYKLDVTAYSNPNHDLDKTYVILSGDPELNVGSPEFQQYATQVERAIAAKGYRRVSGEDLSSAALGVYVTAAVSDAGKRYHTVSTGVYESPRGEEISGVVVAKGTTSNPNPSGGINQVRTPVPEQLTGYEEKSFATVVYTKHLNLVAIDLQQYISDIEAVGRNDAVPKEIWSVDIETTGKPSDLDEVLPVMLAAGQDYVADSTDDVVHVKMSAADRRIDAIRGN